MAIISIIQGWTCMKRSYVLCAIPMIILLFMYGCGHGDPSRDIYKEARVFYDSVLNMQISDDKIDGYFAAIEKFAALDGYSDSLRLIGEIKQNIYDNALYRQSFSDARRLEAGRLFLRLGDYLDSEQRAEEILVSYYTRGITSMEHGSFDAALQEFNLLAEINYRDSSEKVIECRQILDTIEEYEDLITKLNSDIGAAWQSLEDFDKLSEPPVVLGKIIIASRSTGDNSPKHVPVVMHTYSYEEGYVYYHLKDIIAADRLVVSFDECDAMIVRSINYTKIGTTFYQQGGRTWSEDNYNSSTKYFIFDMSSKRQYESPWLMDGETFDDVLVKLLG